MENTIFFGNGINRLSPGNISWDQLLSKIKGPRKFEDNDLPNTMIYERIILERPSTHKEILDDEFEVKQEISGLMQNVLTNEIYVELFNLNAQHYLTTNYDYAFINSIMGLDEVNLPIQEYSTEGVYSMRRSKRISNRKQQKKYVWQIHGEIRKPATIMLGLDHYCGAIGKIDNYIKGHYKYKKDKTTIVEKSIEEKYKNKSFNNSSWVELFFTSNVHIFGFSLDYAEIDLWWIINKRARMKKSNLSTFVSNEINFYCDDKIDEQKKGILKMMNVNVNIIKMTDSKTKYPDYYKNLIKTLKKKL